MSPAPPHDPRQEVARALALLPSCGFSPSAVEEVAARCAAALDPAQDRRLPAWLDAAAALPAPVGAVEVEGAVRAGERWGEGCDSADPEELLRALSPWRKGPLWLGGVHVDTEWRSDWKWERVRPHLGERLRGARALDVGGGNGYHGWRMWGAGAAGVVVIDPTLLSHAQFCAAQRALALALSPAPPPAVGHLPLTLEALTAAGRGAFDVVFSMGVLYHRRDPEGHIAELLSHTRAGGLLVLETLVWGREGEDAALPLAGGRYANMRNVWSLPTPARVLRWLAEAGLGGGRLVDLTPTTVEEQRRTEWMTFFSLAEALDPADPTRTVEGHPAPLRATFLAEAP